MGWVSDARSRPRQTCANVVDRRGSARPAVRGRRRAKRRASELIVHTDGLGPGRTAEREAVVVGAVRLIQRLRWERRPPGRAGGTGSVDGLRERRADLRDSSGGNGVEQGPAYRQRTTRCCRWAFAARVPRCSAGPGPGTLAAGGFGADRGRRASWPGRFLLEANRTAGAARMSSEHFFFFART